MRRPELGRPHMRKTCLLISRESRCSFCPKTLYQKWTTGKRLGGLAEDAAYDPGHLADHPFASVSLSVTV